MSWVAAAVVGGAVIGGIATSSAAGDAADAQIQSTNASNQTQLEMFNQNRADLEPWRNAGKTALDQMTSGTAPGGDFARSFTLADFNADPGYAFRRQQGQDALEHSAAARGGLLSGGTGKALQRYGQDFASTEFSNAYNRFNNDRTQRFNRLASIAGLGQTATRDVAQMGTDVAGRIGENQVGAGNARAAGMVGQGNAISGAAGSIGSYFAMRQFLGQGMTPAAPSAVPPNPFMGGGVQGGFDNFPTYG